MADADILIGPGTLWVAPVAEANPDETTIAYGAAWGGNWESLGQFLEGQPVTLGVSETFTYVRTEQSTSPKATVRTQRDLMISTTLAEYTPENMAYVYDSTATATAAAVSQKGFSSVPIGDQSTVSLYKFGIEGFRYDTNGDPQPVRYFLHRGHIRLAGDTAFSKQNPTGVPIEIMVLGDGSQATGSEIGTLEIVTAPATG